MNSNEKVIWDAEFNDAVTTYWLLNGTLICIFSIVGILFLPVWLLAGKWVTRKYLASHRCILSNRTLKVSKGVFTKVEKTVPLDRITDLGIVQGPIMRLLNIEALSVETAGQSSAGSLVHLAGIKDGRKFRDAVLKQRDNVVGSFENQSPGTVGTAANAENNEIIALLREMNQTLKKIENKNPAR